MSGDEEIYKQRRDLGLPIPKVTQNNKPASTGEPSALAETIEAINEAKTRIITGGTGEGAGGAFSRDDDIEALTRAQIAAAEKDLGYHD